MTNEQQAEYLIANGWKREGELWKSRNAGYLWEQSAAVKQQQFLDRLEARENGK
jgi:hypothetical protein